MGKVKHPHYCLGRGIYHKDHLKRNGQKATLGDTQLFLLNNWYLKLVHEEIALKVLAMVTGKPQHTNQDRERPSRPTLFLNILIAIETNFMVEIPAGKTIVLLGAQPPSLLQQLFS